MAFGSPANCVFRTISSDYPNRQESGLCGTQVSPTEGRAASPRLLLVMFPLGLGKFWGLRKQGIHLTLLLGDKESRKPGPPLAFPIPHELELRPHQRPPILRVLTSGS